jgi:hypothetical protein
MMVGVGWISEALRRPLVAPSFWTKMGFFNNDCPGGEDMGGGYLVEPALEAFTGGAALEGAGDSHPWQRAATGLSLGSIVAPEPEPLPWSRRMFRG